MKHGTPSQANRGPKIRAGHLHQVPWWTIVDLSRRPPLSLVNTPSPPVASVGRGGLFSVHYAYQKPVYG